MTLDQLADQIRLKVYARRMEPIEDAHGPVAWRWLTLAQQTQWREIAWAAAEVAGMELQGERPTAFETEPLGGTDA